MLSRDRIFEEARSIIRSAAGASVEVVVNSYSSSAVRFSNSVFHQGISEDDCAVYIRAALGKRVGVASTNSFNIEALGACLKEAVRIAEHVREEPFPVVLPGPCAYAQINSFFESTASITDAGKVSMLSGGFRDAEKDGVLQSGIFTATGGEVAVLNSNGVEAYHPYTVSHLSVVSSKGASSGFRSALSKDITEIDVRGVMAESARRCSSALAPKDCGPGFYRVLFEPHAVSELIQWLSYTGFGAKNFQEGTSFLSGRLGEKVTGEKVTIYDDGESGAGISVPFDMEGAPKRRLPLIEKGVARGAAYDSFTGALSGHDTTGHAGFPDDSEGPMPGHLFMEGGSLSSSDMLERLGTGIYVRSFHYVNGLLNPKETLMTGMTRHGTFFVEGGKVKYPVRPMRFTENIIRAFERIEDASSGIEVFPHHGFHLSSIAAPYLLIDGFRFTS